MILLTDELYELMLENIEDKGVREQVFEEKVDISNDDKSALCSALKTDIKYWEDCIRHHPKAEEGILRHMRRYISDDKKLMDIFHI